MKSLKVWLKTWWGFLAILPLSLMLIFGAPDKINSVLGGLSILLFVPINIDLNRMLHRAWERNKAYREFLDGILAGLKQ